MNPREFGQFLRETRKQKNLTIRQVEVYSGVSNSYLSLVERGERGIPSPDILKKLAPVLKVPYETLMREAGYLPPSDASPKKFAVHEDLTKYGLAPAGPMVRIPVLGTIRAGVPMYAEQNIIRYEEVPASAVKDGKYFYLLVTGDSMINDRIYPGCLVRVRCQNYVDDGKIAVVLVNGDEATVKRVRYTDGKVVLIPANPLYKPQIYDEKDIKILGEVVKIETIPD